MRKSRIRSSFLAIMAVSIILSTFAPAYLSRVHAEEADTAIAIVNPGFEEDTSDEPVPGWWQFEGDTVSVSSANKASGANSLLLDKPSAKLYSSLFAVVPGSSYTVTAGVYLVSSTDSKFQLNIRFIDAAGDPIAGHKENRIDAPADLWTTQSVTDTAPAGAVKATVYLVNEDDSSAGTFVDDVSVRKEPSQSEAGIQNPGFEQTDGAAVPGWEQVYGTTGFAITSTQAYSGDNSLYVNDELTDRSFWLYSSHIPVTAGETYGVAGMVYLESGTVSLNVAYFDANRTMLTYKGVDIAGETGKWKPAGYKLEAPAGAVTAAVFIYSGYGAVGKAYFDDISLSLVPSIQSEYMASENLGPVVKTPTTVSAAFGKTASAGNELYFGLSGEVTKFYAVNAETGHVLFSQDIPGMTHLYGIVMGSDRNVYFTGTHDGILYRYLPEQKRIENLGANPSGTWVWDLEATEDGKLYGSTYGEKSRIFEYDIASGLYRDFGPVQTNPSQAYARGLGVTDKYIYVGVGLPDALIRVDRVTGEMKEIQTPYTGQQRMAADVWVYNGKLFVRDESSFLVVLDEQTEAVENTLRFKVKLSPPSPTNNEVVYYKRDSALYSYNMATKTEAAVAGLPTLPMTAPVQFDWIVPQSGEKQGKPLLAMMLEFTEYMLIDPEDGWFQIVPIQAEAQGIEIQSVETGPDGRVYIGGYMTAMSIFNPKTGVIEHNESLFPQAEGIGFLGDEVFFGTYGGAVMYRYDPSKPFHFGVTAGDNPGLSYDIGQGQDRPFTLTSGDGKLFVGTIPTYGLLGGSLAVYDKQKNEWNEYANIVQNQSIIGLAYEDGKLYGGTSVWGGSGIAPTEQEAKIFVWDAAESRVIEQFTLSIPGIDTPPKMIGELSFGPDGLLWGAVSGTIFAMDPDSKAIVKSKMIYNSNYQDTSTWRPYYLRWGNDGYLYTTLGRQLTVIDPVTLNSKVLDPGIVSLMTVTDEGTIYYAKGANLYRMIPKHGNVSDSVLRKLEIETKTAVTAEETFQAAAYAETGKGERIDVTMHSRWQTSDRDIITVEADGTAKAHKAGTVELAARYGNETVKASITVTGPSPTPTPTSTPTTTPTTTPTPTPTPTTTPTTTPTPTPTPTTTPTPTPTPVSTTPGNGSTSTPTASPSPAPVLFTVNGEKSLELTERQIEEGSVMVEAERFDLTLKDAQSIAERNGNFRFIIHAEQGAITLPISVLDQLPADEDDSKGSTGIRISISIRESDSETADSIRKGIRQSGGKLLSNPIRVEAFWTDADGRQNALDLAGNGGTIQLSFHEPLSAKNAAVTRFDPITGHMRFVPALVSPDKAVFAIAEGGIRDYAIAAAGAVFADISGHWAQDAAEALAAAMIVSGRSEGSFEPSGTVTRAEFAAMLARGLGLPKENTTVMNDTNGQKPWYTDYVGALQQAGIIQGFEDGSMRLDADVTRQEMAVMLARALVYTGNEPDAQGDIARYQYRFADGGNIEPWALNGVLHVIQTGIMQGDEENRLRPDAAASRAESAVVLLRMLEAASYLSRLQ